MTHRGRLASRWLVGIAATVVSGVTVAGLLWIGSTLVSQGKQQVSSDATTRAQIAALTDQVTELRAELAGVPQLRDRVSTLEAHQADLTQRVTQLEAQR
jgi:outer membrane murein-binding lipoprotein Lpp